jgi:hypothetical protein
VIVKLRNSGRRNFALRFGHTADYLVSETI